MTAKERIRELIKANKGEIAAAVREHSGLCRGQALLVEFRDQPAPDHVVHFASPVYLQRQARRIAPEVGKAFLRSMYAARPGTAPALCLYMRGSGDVAAVDLQAVQNDTN